MSETFENYQVEQFEQAAYQGAMLEAGKEWERQRNEFDEAEYNLQLEIERLNSQLATRDALIERLGSKLKEAYLALIWNAVLKTEEDAAEFEVLIAEWKEMKGGEA